MNIQINNPFVFESVGNRFYKLAQPARITVRYDSCGEWEFEFARGVVINFRSGGPLVDLFCDQMGENQFIQAAYAIHDLMYTPINQGSHAFTRQFADDKLYDMLIYAGMPKIKAKMIFAAVRMFGGSAYTDDDKYTKDNIYLMSYTWRP